MNCPYCEQDLTEEITGVMHDYVCTNESCQGYLESMYEGHGLEFESDVTGRGFGIYKFKDRYNEDCTLQESSLATEPAIWFGTSGRVEVFTPHVGWKDHELPSGALVHSRMHLTQLQVQQLLPVLQHFAKYGELPYERPDEEGEI